MKKTPVDKAVQHQWRLVTPRVGRDISDENWEKWETSYIAVWNKAQEIYSNTKIPYDESQYELKFDFKQIINHISHYLNTMDRLANKKEREAAAEFWHHDAICEFTSKPTPPRGEPRDRNLSSSLISFLYHEIFLVLNLSAPGSCNFGHAYYIAVPPEIGFRGSEYRHDINLYNRCFEVAIYESNSFPWLRVDVLELETVLSWVRYHCPFGKMVPETPAARSLFALLHISKTDIEPTSIIWIFYALEAIYDCKVGENFGALQRRMAAFLGIGENESKVFKKRMRELYNRRSSIVHGGAKIVHPDRNEILDRSVDDEISKDMDSFDFGCALVIATLQKLISLNWSGVKFPETVVGEAMAG